VVVSGTQHVRSGMTVTPRLIPMPGSTQAGAAAAPSPPAPTPRGPQPAPTQQQNYPPRGQTR
jgi:hypothetical protein